MNPTPHQDGLPALPEAFHPKASHIPPDYRDGWNHCHEAFTAALAAHPNAQPASPERKPLTEGLSLTQEPKYTVNGSAIVNRASGEAIPADEPVFIFRARDVHAMYALRDYLNRLPLGSSHRKAVEQRTMEFFDFKAANPGRMKEPDTHGIAATQEPRT